MLSVAIIIIKLRRVTIITYLISFLEGIITFISPCLLPMLPIYIIYFAGGAEHQQRRTIFNALGFVLGFSIIFILMGAFASGIGSLLNKYQTMVNIITGAIVIVFGLNFIGLFRIGFLNSSHKISREIKPLGFFSAGLFGMIFAVGWTPCVGAFLGSALLLASQQGSIGKGILMLLVYSLGLGLPFIISAVLIEKLKGTFDFIKKNYRIINIICGSLLIIVGILMITGKIGKLLSIISG